MSLRLLFLLLSMLWFSDNSGRSADDDGDDQNDNSDDQDDESSDDDDGDDDDDEELGEGGKKALRDERRARRTAEAEADRLRRENRRLARQARGQGGNTKGDKNGKGGKQGDESDDGGEWKTRFEELDRRYRTETVRNRVSAEAAKRNAIDPAAVARLVELDDVEFDEKGEKITNLDDLMKELAEDFPKLFKKSPGKGNGGDEPGRPRKVKPGLDRLTAAYETESKAS